MILLRIFNGIHIIFGFLLVVADHHGIRRKEMQREYSDLMFDYYYYYYFLLLYFSCFVYVKSHIICIINGISRARNFINDTRCKRFNIKTINWLIIGTLLAWLRLLIENRVVCLLNRWENDRKCEMCISWIFMMTSGNRTEDV